MLEPFKFYFFFWVPALEAIYIQIQSSFIQLLLLRN